MDNELSHFGVKGMKWGVRKSRTSTVESSPRKKLKSKEIKSLSDDELRKRINRIQMEKQYKQLTKREQSKGSKVVKDILIGGAKVAAAAYVTKVVGDNIASVMDPLLGRKK